MTKETERALLDLVERLTERAMNTKVSVSEYTERRTELSMLAIKLKKARNHNSDPHIRRRQQMTQETERALLNLAVWVARGYADKLEETDNMPIAASNIGKAIEAVEATMRYEQPDLSKCPTCGGPADNGHDRCDPPNPYECSRCDPSGRDAVNNLTRKEGMKNAMKVVLRDPDLVTRLRGVQKLSKVGSLRVSNGKYRDLLRDVAKLAGRWIDCSGTGNVLTVECVERDRAQVKALLEELG